MKVFKFIVIAMALISGAAHASVTKKYKIKFMSDYGMSANSVKKDVVDRLPYIFNRYVTDVEWSVIRNGNGYIVVKLKGDNANRIQGWLYTIQAETQDAISEISSVR